MHKFAIAAAVTVTAAGAGALAVTATRTDAHAETTSTKRDEHVAAKSAPAPRGAHGGSPCSAMEHLRRSPSLASLIAPGTAANEMNDCAAVGHHLADLQADATHGPDQRPADESMDTCGSQYQALCESQHWSAERRSCTLAAGDLINAHLCQGQVPASVPPSSVPPQLACSVIGPHLATLLQAAGMHEDMPDLPQQFDAACEIGNWSIELRTCFEAATTIDALKACIGDDT